jgi:hypothetical protein
MSCETLLESLRFFYHETGIPTGFNQFQDSGAWGGNIMSQRVAMLGRCRSGGTPHVLWIANGLGKLAWGALAPEWLR